MTIAEKLIEQTDNLINETSRINNRNPYIDLAVSVLGTLAIVLTLSHFS